MQVQVQVQVQVLYLIIGGLSGCTRQITPAEEVFCLEGVGAEGQAGGGRDHPGAVLPRQGGDVVLVPGRLGDLQHHLVPLQLAGQAGRVGKLPGTSN